MAVAFPKAPHARSIGVGLDLPWAGEVGLGPRADGSEGPTEPVRRFFDEHARELGHVFVSLQARDRSIPRIEDYRASWDALFAHVPNVARGLHHTALSLGSLAPIDRTRALDLTAELVRRYDLAWVNEDAGFWSLEGRPLPYPLPPVLDRRALPHAIRAARECQVALPVPLVIEFPGCSEHASVVLGSMHAYDFFRVLAEESEAPVTLDVGHLLSYQWLRGHRGDDLFDELDRLPLAHAFELHLAGSAIVDGHFVDAHHGVLLAAQLDLAERLVPFCPNLRAITFEDPVLRADGSMNEASAASFTALRERMQSWLGADVDATNPAPRRGEHDAIEIDLAPLERALAAEVTGRTRPELEPSLDALLDAPTHGSIACVRKFWQTRTFARVHRGVGTIGDRFPGAFAAWRARHSDDADFSRLAAEVFASDEALAYREGLHAQDGASIEEVFAAFAERHELGDPIERENERARALVQALTIHSAPAFRVPSFVRARGGALIVLARRGPTTMHAACRGRYLSGCVTPLVADLLEATEPNDTLATRHGVTPAAIELAASELVRLGLLAPPA